MKIKEERKKRQGDKSENARGEGKRHGRGLNALSAVCAAVVLTGVLSAWSGRLFFVEQEKQSGSREDRLLLEAENTLVQVDSQGLSGSGVLLAVTETDVRVVTAAHVLRDRSEARITFCDGFAVSCTDIRVVQDADVAFLQVPLSRMQDAAVDGYRCAVTDKERYDALSAGDRVLCFGRQEAGQDSVFEGVLTENWIYVEDFAQYMIVAECQILPGMSGGGLYDEQGHLIGIVCGGNEQGELAAVPLHVVQAKYMEQY